MNIPTNTVLSVGLNKINIFCSDSSKFKFLIQLGAKRKILNRSMWCVKYDNNSELSKRFISLRDHGFMFSGGSSGWTPSCIFQTFKAEGNIDGEAVEVVWTSSNAYKVRKI